MQNAETTKRRPSMRKAINDFCKWCIYDPISGQGNWREQVGACAAMDCPLHPLRPQSRGGIRAAD